MRKCKSFLLWLIKVCFSGLIAVIILSLFVLIYHNEGVHISNSSGATDYKWEPKQWKSQMVEGFSWLNMDNEGFNNISESTGDLDILLMGSSHMEALQVSPRENVGSLLNESFPNLTVYNIGMSGHTIYRCVDNIKDAAVLYEPNKYIIVETDRVELDIQEMQKVIDGVSNRIPSYDAGLFYYIQKIPAAKLLYGQIDNWKSADDRLVERDKSIEDSESDNELPENYQEVLDDFLKICSDSIEDTGCRIIIIYQPFTNLKRDGDIDFKCNSQFLSAFESSCDKNNIVFIDMTEDFNSFYQEKNILAHGFSNTAVGVGHLNKYGHMLMANKLTETVLELEEK